MRLLLNKSTALSQRQLNSMENTITKFLTLDTAGGHQIKPHQCTLEAESELLQPTSL